MKVELTENKECFKPISITITIETREELDMLIAMHAKNCSIPDLMKKEHTDLCYRYLKNIYSLLNK